MNTTPKYDRNAVIVAKRRGGWSLRALAREYGVTHARIQQIIWADEWRQVDESKRLKRTTLNVWFRKVTA